MAAVVVAAILLFLFAPIALVVLFSFNGGRGTSPPFKGFSTRWYEDIFGDPVFLSALQNSMVAAIITAVVVLTVGTLTAFALARGSSRLLNAVSTFVITPLVIPGLVIGIALLSFFSRLHVELSIWTVAIGHALVTLPFVVLIVNARLVSFDWSIEEAARDLGASQFRAFRSVVLPACLPALVGATLVTVAWSLDEFAVTLFTNGGATTVPVLIYSNVRQGIDPSINATATVILSATIVLAVVSSRFLSARELAR